MKTMTAHFTAHPASVGETYLQHLASASRYSFQMIGAGVCCFIHGLLPFLFVRTGSAAVAGLHARMIVNRSRLSGAPAVPARGADVLNAG